MDEPAPVLRVVRGDPTGPELAALASVLLTRAAATPARPSPPPPRRRWRRPTRP